MSSETVVTHPLAGAIYPSFHPLFPRSISLLSVQTLGPDLITFNVV